LSSTSSYTYLALTNLRPSSQFQKQSKVFSAFKTQGSSMPVWELWDHNPPVVIRLLTSLLVHVQRMPVQRDSCIICMIQMLYACLNFWCLGGAYCTCLKVTLLLVILML